MRNTLRFIEAQDIFFLSKKCINYVDKRKR